MHNPILTVLMAVYNGERYIRTSVESVLRQSFEDFEFLIINDQSTDRTLAILEEFQKKDPRVVIHTNQNNLGQTKSLNAGLRLARGKYVARMDADDFALPHWLETQVAAARKNPEAAVISTQALVIDDKNSIRRIARSPAAMPSIILRSFTFSPVNHVGSILKKETVIKNGGYDEHYKTAADFDLWGKLVRNGESICSSEAVLVAIRMHPQSYSMTEIDKGGLAEISSIMKRNIDHFTHQGISEHEVDLLGRAFYREGCLTDNEFEQAVAILKRAYGEVSGPDVASGKTIEAWSAARCKVAYLKRIHYFISQKKYAAVRMLARKSVKEFGPGSVFMALWGASFLGGGILNQIPKFYNWLLRQKTLLFPGVGQSTGKFNGLLKELSERRYYLDFLGFFSIGIFSLGYVLFYRQFAELNIHLPFLNFPIFVGEVLLFLCLCAFLLKGDLRIEKKHYWIVGYFAFVLLKALYGYIKFGPLALRHAALFYYPAFIIFAYSFYRKEFLNRKKSILITVILLIALARPGFIDYFLFTCVALAFILIYAYPAKFFKYLSLAAFFLIIPYKSFFATSRMGIVANLATGMFLIIGLYCISNMKRSQKLALAILVLLFIAGLIFRLADRNSLITLIHPSIIVSKFIEHDKLFKEIYEQNLIIGQKPGDAPNVRINGPRQIQVYNPDQLLTAPRLSEEEETIKKKRVANTAPVAMSDKPLDIPEVSSLQSATESAGVGNEAVADSEGSIMTPGTLLTNDTVKSELELESQEIPAGMSEVSTVGGSVAEEASKIELAVSEPTPAIAPILEDNEKTTTAGNAESKAAGPVLLTDVIVNDETERPDEPEPLPAVESFQAKSDFSPKPKKSLVNFDDLERYEEKNSKEAKWRDLGPAYGNAVFRLLIWRDMSVDLITKKQIFGFSFGKPFRSITLETLMWGYGDWHRDGWIGAHNSFMEIVYRMGVLGVCLIGYIIRTLSRMVMCSIRSKSLIGVLLCGIIVYWFVGANFLMILELPYTAIPIWSIFGLAYAYIGRLQPSR
jgi:glycosyltransferase involved in cell wall biosynthesis